jgi:hypothetical protein
VLLELQTKLLILTEGLFRTKPPFRAKQYLFPRTGLIFLARTSNPLNALKPLDLPMNSRPLPRRTIVGFSPTS